MNHLHRMLKHPVALSLLVFAVWMAAVLTIHIIGVRQLGSLAAWNEWVTLHCWYFRVWRLFMYGAVAYGLWWRRQRILRRDSSPEMRRALMRTNLAALVVMAFGELQVTIRQG